MADNVVKLVPEHVGEGYRFDPNDILSEAMENKFSTVAVIGETEEGEIYFASSANFGETMIMIEVAKLRQLRDLVNG